MATPTTPENPPAAPPTIEEKPLRRVKMLHSTATPGECYHLGKTYDVDDAVATGWLANGLAEEVHPEPKGKGAKK